MKINCSLVLGEWDMDNRLGKEIPHFSHYGDKWNNKAYRNVDDMRDAVEIMNNSPNALVAISIGIISGLASTGCNQIIKQLLK